MAYPVVSRTKSGVARSIGSPTKAANAGSLTRLVPLTITSKRSAAFPAPKNQGLRDLTDAASNSFSSLLCSSGTRRHLPHHGAQSAIPQRFLHLRCAAALVSLATAHLASRSRSHEHYPCLEFYRQPFSRQLEYQRDLGWPADELAIKPVRSVAPLGDGLDCRASEQRVALQHLQVMHGPIFCHYCL